tara:strand:- start:6860 stop:7006 length:147 start_codon:yes stop_codon:yes gene_type:complete
MKIPDNLFDATIVSFLWAEEFVKRTLIGIYYLWQKFDYWNFNRKLPKT